VRYKHLPIAIAWLMLLIAPAADAKRPERRADDQAALYVFLQPLGAGADRLSVRLGGVAALQADGSTASAIELAVEEIDGERWVREQRLAAGVLPPGRYGGLELEIVSAELKVEQGTAELATPEQPVRVPVGFTLTKRQAAVLTLRLDFKASIEEGFRFAPRFSAAPVPRPAPGLLGLATARGSDSVTFFDKASARVVGVVPTGRAPAGLVLDQERKRAFVTLSGADAVVEIGLLEYAVLNSTRLQGGDTPVEMARTPDGQTLLTSNAGSSTVSVIDASSLVETARLRVGDEPRGIVVDATGSRAYVCNTSSSTVSVLDIKARTLLATIGTDAGPFRVQLSPEGDAVYVIHRFSPHLTVIDPETLAVVNRVYLGPGSTALKVDSQSGYLYVGRKGARSIDVYDPRSFLPIDSIAVAGDVAAIEIDVERNTLYAVVPSVGEVQLFDVVGRKLEGHVDAGEDPFWVVVSGER
jgi:YVTN family beta-propeller protein